MATDYEDRPEPCTCFGGYCYRRFCKRKQGRASVIDPDDLRTAADFVKGFMQIVTYSDNGTPVHVNPPDGMTVEECGRQAAGLVSRLRKEANDMEERECVGAGT